jgi:hypothetical protein
MVGPGVVEVGPADCAQTGTIGAAEQLLGEAESQRVASPGGEVEDFLCDVGTFELLALAGL